jgi:predicted RNA methylase
MLYDKARMGSFRDAINYIVKPGSTVLELGSGTGVLSFFAAEKARKVYSVEFNLDLVEQSRRFFKMNRNRNGDRIEVIHADAFEYIPPEPVDVVICEMLHVGLLREKQLAVIDAFKSNYQKRFDAAPLPMFIPDATIQAVQPIQHDFDFDGFYAPIILFQYPYSIDPRTTDLGTPVIYNQILYDQQFNLSCQWGGALSINAEGTFNAIRIATKNILAIIQEPGEQTDINWHNQYLVQPVEQEIPVKPGQNVAVNWDYNAGDPLTALRPVVNGLL